MVSNKPWGSVTPADYSSAEAYCAACLIDLNTGRKSKGACKLPVREPSGALNRNAIHAAAAALAGARGGVPDAPAAARRAAARKLIGLYRELEEDPPESLRRLAAS